MRRSQSPLSSLPIYIEARDEEKGQFLEMSNWTAQQVGLFYDEDEGKTVNENEAEG